MHIGPMFLLPYIGEIINHTAMLHIGSSFYGNMEGWGQETEGQFLVVWCGESGRNFHPQITNILGFSHID